MADADASLHEYIDAEFTVEGLHGATAEQALLDALAGRAGIRRAALSEGKLLVEYEPVLVNKHQLLETLAAAGFPAKEIEYSQASPVVDALQDEEPR